MLVNMTLDAGAIWCSVCVCVCVCVVALRARVLQLLILHSESFTAYHEVFIIENYVLSIAV